MTYLLRLSACLFLCISLNSFGDAIYSFLQTQNDGQDYLASINPVNNQVNIISHTELGGSRLLQGGLAAVPLPVAFWLFASGLISLRLFKR